MKTTDTMPCMDNCPVESFFHDTGSGRIFCTMVGDPASSGECVIYFAPLFEERMWSQRIAFNFARELWRYRRTPTFMFDYYGYGESDGDSEDFCLTRSNRDTESLLALLSNKYHFTHFILWSIRTGSSVALEALSLNFPYSSVVFWAPVTNLHDYIYNSLRSTISGQMFLFRQVLANRDAILEELLKNGECIRRNHVLNNIDGYRFGKILYEESKHLEKVDLLATLGFPVLLVDISSLQKNRGMSSQAEISSPSNITSLKVIDNQFWLNCRDYSQRAEKVYLTTLKWLDERDRFKL